ncbi:HIT-like protein [Trametes coccinea BRFM310]|uniref:HIT-like protein n=1 Tax=Trametes coccinea (strain BRFM310) TaxID=1353009 RepID=A0A1Y2IPB5_TRAC3|nr:HIT-like protein [Trametes coccinea BRFM310]
MPSHLDDSCFFCKITKGKQSVHRSCDVYLCPFAFLDIGPLAEGHTLIIPKYHSARMDEVPDEYLAEILPLAKKIAKALGVVDYNILQNNGKIAHQHVFHVHFHVIPKPNDKKGLIVGWPRVEQPKEVLEKKLADIVSKL